MTINNDSLRAFLSTYELKSFTKASLQLGLTQSALSQKISRLEDQLESSLFIRKAEGIELTAYGEKLLLFARQQIQMEDEFLNQFTNDSNGVGGQVRIASFSSVMRSRLLPKLAPFLKKNPKLSLEFSSHEVLKLPHVLKTNQSDFIILDYFSLLPGVEEVQIGTEEYVVIEALKHKHIPDVYLDHNPDDNATAAYFKFQGSIFNFDRKFMGDVYGIIDGVALGLGRAVMSKHLIENDPRFKIIKSKKKFERPLVLNYFKQAYYPQSHLRIIELLKEI
jgi:DNA-binding transcriptional LysR family regulator